MESDSQRGTNVYNSEASKHAKLVKHVKFKKSTETNCAFLYDIHVSYVLTHLNSDNLYYLHH